MRDVNAENPTPLEEAARVRPAKASLDASVLQIWLGKELPPETVLSMMMQMRVVSKRYTLVTREDSPLRDVLNPDKFLDEDAIHRDMVKAYPRAGAYNAATKSPRRLSDLLRFYLLSLHPDMLYVDADCLLHEYSHRRALEKNVVFGQYRGKEADIFLIHGGGQADFFARALKSVEEGSGPSCLRNMVKSHPHRFNPSDYTHLTRKRHHETLFL
jgi:hypothetical protein